MIKMKAGARFTHEFDDCVKLEAFAGWDFSTLLGLEGRRFPDDVVDAALTEESLGFSMHGLSTGVTLVF